MSATIPRRIVQAAMDEYEAADFNSVAFSSICARAHVSKASAYRFFPKGQQSLLDYFHRSTIASVVKSIRSSSRDLSEQVEFSAAVTSGVQAGIDALAHAPYTSRVLVGNRDALTSYLLRRGPGSILAVLSEYAARCAASFGSSCVDTRVEAERFVWDLFSVVVRGIPQSPHETFVWPKIGDPSVQHAIEHFSAATRLQGVTRSGLAVPTVSIPAEVGEDLLVPLAH